MEVFILKRCHHQNIIAFLDYFSDEKYAYLITELHGTSWAWPNPKIDSFKNPGLRGPNQLIHRQRSLLNTCVGIPGITRRLPYDLFECIEAHSFFPMATIKKVFSQLVGAVLYLYSMGTVHRDLKDENIVIDEDYNLKVIDFGSAGMLWGLEDDRALNMGEAREANMCEPYFDTFYGTIAFAPPEIVKKEAYLSSEAEVWTLGVLLYTLLFKKIPFFSAEEITHMPLDLPLEDQPGPYDLVRHLLQKNPNKRIKLFDIPRHPFLN